MDAGFRLRKPEDGMEADIAQALNEDGFKADASPLFVCLAVNIALSY